MHIRVPVPEACSSSMGKFESCVNGGERDRVMFLAGDERFMKTWPQGGIHIFPTNIPNFPKILCDIEMLRALPSFSLGFASYRVSSCNTSQECSTYSPLSVIRHR